MAGVPWTEEERKAFHRLRAGPAEDVSDLRAKLSAETGREFTRPQVDSMLLRCGVSAADVKRAHWAGQGSAPKVDPPERSVKVTPEPEAPIDLRARVAELEAQLAAAAPVEEGSAVPGKDRTIGLLFDLHLPEHDRPAWASFLKWARDEQPDEIILSEFAEWLAASQHGNGAWGARWDEEVATVRRGLIQLRSVVPHADIVMEESNHDTRLTRILEDRLPAFAGALTIPQALGLADLGIRWVGERTVLRRGSLKIIHGHQLESGMRGALPKYHAARAVQLYGERGTTVVYGHTHKTQSWCEPCDGGDKRAVNIGCMRTLVPAWHKARESGWVHQFGIAYVAASGSTNLYVVDVTRGGFAFGGRRYAA